MVDVSFRTLVTPNTRPFYYLFSQRAPRQRRELEMKEKPVSHSLMLKSENQGADYHTFKGPRAARAIT